MAKEKVIVDVRDLVLSELQTQERGVTWLSRKTGIPYSTLYNILKHRISTFDESQLKSVNDILKTDFKLSK